MGFIFKPKVKSWEEVREDIEEKIECQKEVLPITIPYGLQLQEFLWNPEVLRLAVHVCLGSTGNSFVSHHGAGSNNEINIWSITKDKKTGELKKTLKTIHTSLRFQNIYFIYKRWIYVAFCNDLTLKVLSPMFGVISSTFTFNTILTMEYNEGRDELVTGIAGGIMTWQFPVKQTDPLIPGRVINCSFTPDDWVHTLKFDPNSKQILAISHERIVILSDKSYEVDLYFQKKSDFAFTTCVFYHPASYFITGDRNGSIRAWSTSISSLPLVTQFLGHCDGITNLLIHDQEPLLVSSSLDKTIRIWNFDTFMQTYRLQTGEEVIGMNLMNTDQLFYYSKHNLKIWNLNLFHSLFTVLSSRISRCMRVKAPGYPARIMVQAVDGGIRLISPVHGYEVTMMLPITTLSTYIVDFAHDRRKEKVYVVLGTREVLVFESDTNPCCANQLWRPENTDEGVCSIAILNSEFALPDGDMELESGLLFAGLYNGQISLLDGIGVSMAENVQAHQGQVIFLTSSHSHADSLDSIGTRDHLVSCGTDHVIRIWQVRHQKPKLIEIESKSRVRLLQLPREVKMVGNTLCLAMGDYKVVMCRIKKESTKAFVTQKCFEFLTHAKDEGHTAVINGLSSCPTLQLFATSSEDQSVKIWDFDNHLVRELNFDETLCGVCFANSRGDILVGFQSHISLVCLTNYLPGPYLERVATMDFENEGVEKHVQFDDHLQFWYDPQRVPTVPLELNKRRPILPPEIPICPWEEESDSDTEKNVCMKPEDDGLNWLRRASRRMSIMSQGSILSRMSIMSHADTGNGRRSVVAGRRSSLFDSVGRNAEAFDAQQSISRTGQQLDDLLTNREQASASRDDDEAAFLPPRYWPCAPDCYIPNSVVRKYVKVKKPPAHMIPRMIRPVKEKKKREKKEDPFEAMNKSARRKMILLPKKTKTKFKELPKRRGIKDEQQQRRQSFPMQTASKLAELRGRRKTLAAGKPIFEEMSEGEDEEEEEEEEEEDEEEKEEEEKQEMELDYGERDENYETSSESEEELPEVEEEDIKIPVLEIKPRELEGPEVLKRIAKKAWYPRVMGGKLKVQNVLNDIGGVMVNCDPVVFTDLCKELIAIDQELGFPEEQKLLIHDLLMKNTFNESPVIRQLAIQTLAKLCVTTKDATLAMIRRLIDDTEEVRDEAKHALTTLHGVNDLEDLSKLLMKMGVVSMYLPSRDNAILAELSERIGRIKQSKKKVDFSKTHDWSAIESPVARKRPRIPATRARRDSVPFKLHDAISPNNLESFHDELKHTSLGCKLLQQLGPISQQVAMEFGRLPTSPIRETIECESPLTILGRSVGEDLTSRGATIESFRQTAMASSSSSSLTPKEPASPVLLPHLVERKASRMECMLGTAIVKRRSLAGDAQRFLSRHDVTPILPSVSIVSTVTASDSVVHPFISNKAESPRSLDREDTAEQQMLTFGDLIEALSENTDTQLGRAMVLSMLNLKRNDSFSEIGDSDGTHRPTLNEFFNPQNFLRVFAILPDMLVEGTPLPEALENILMERSDVLGESDKKFEAKLEELFSSTFLTGTDDKEAEVRKYVRTNIKQFEEKKSERGGKEVDNLFKIFSLYPNPDDRKLLLKHVMKHMMKNVQKIGRTVNDKKKKSKTTKRRSLSLAKENQSQKLEATRRQDKKDKRAAEDETQRISILQSPIRRNLVPGIHGERLVHSLSIRRPHSPSQGIETSTSEQIVRALPHRLSFHTGTRDWGQSSYGIMEVTWTTRGPRYAIETQDVKSRFSYQKRRLGLRAAEEKSRIHSQHAKPRPRANAYHQPRYHDDQCKSEKSRSHDEKNDKDTCKGNVPPLFRERLKSIAGILGPRVNTVTGVNESDVNPFRKDSRGETLLSGNGVDDYKWYIRDSYLSQPPNSASPSTNYGSPMLPDIHHRTLLYDQSIPREGGTRRLWSHSPHQQLTRDRLLSELDEMHLPPMYNMSEAKRGV